jgi:hypothetical protein
LGGICDASTGTPATIADEMEEWLDENRFFAKRAEEAAE